MTASANIDDHIDRHEFSGNGWITPLLIAQTIKTWQPYYSEPLSVDDAIEILQNCGNLLSRFVSPGPHS